MMRSQWVSLPIAASFALLLVGFQNCAGEMYQPTVLGNASLSDECYSGNSESCADNLGRSQDQLYLRAEGEQYIQVVKSKSGPTYLELGGDCFDATYPSNEIVYEILELRDTGDQVVEKVFHAGFLGSCNSFDRFNVLLRMPSDYNYSLAYSLKLQLIAYDERGQSVTSPSGTHRLQLIPPQP